MSNTQEEQAPEHKDQFNDVAGDDESNNSGREAELEGKGEEVDGGSGNDYEAEKGGETIVGANRSDIESEGREEAAAESDAAGDSAISYELRIETLESALQEVRLTH